MAGGDARAITALPSRDTTTGVRCPRRSAPEALDLSQVMAGGFASQLEMAYRLWRSGGRLAEVPRTFTGRLKGTSKRSQRIALQAAMLVWRLRPGSARQDGGGTWQAPTGGGPAGGRPAEAPAPSSEDAPAQAGRGRKAWTRGK